jgi:hypothetical protein
VVAAMVMKRKVTRLVDIAQAISLWDWDGIMPGPVSLTLVAARLPIRVAKLTYRYYAGS